MTMRAPTYLYVREAKPVRIGALGTGKTVVAKVCATREGVPSAIGTLQMTLVETSPGSEEYFGVFSRDDLLSQLTAAGKIGARVYLHIDDGVVWHDVWPWQVTDIDPDLLPPLTT